MHTQVPAAQHPALYQIFTRMWLGELARAAGAPVTLATVPDAALDRIAARGFELVYLMGVWTLGEEGRQISRTHAAFRAAHDLDLPGWTDADVAGSPFAIARYAVSPAFGGNAGLASLRQRLAARGVGLVLDFVPNHLAPDHHWVEEHPDYFIRDQGGAPVCGQDPYFPPWPDTAQLDLRLAATRAALIDVLGDIAGRCDGVRCDMAMLVLDQVFRRTWAHRPPAPGMAQARGELWAEAIDTVRATHPGFLFIAEAYWDMEWRLQMLGFDFTYDKELYDRLIHGPAAAVQAHLGAAADYQRRSVRFVENHDEPRIAAALAPGRGRAATVIAATVPGMRFFHDGQLEGRKIRASVHLARAAAEPVDQGCVAFHEALLAVLRRSALHGGSFALLKPQEPGAETFIAYRWQAARWTDPSLVIVVNFDAAPGACRIPLDIAGLGGRAVTLTDRLTGEEYRRAGDTLLDPARGLHIELPGYGAHLFEIRAA